MASNTIEPSTAAQDELDKTEKPEQEASPYQSGDEGDDVGTEFERSLARSQSLRKVPSLNKAVSLPREILVVGFITLAQFTTQGE
jgi:hypothetical protein